VAKLPAPSDEAKAKAAEAAAKTAWAGKVDGYLLCKSQDKVAAGYLAKAKAPAAAASVPACADPGPFVYTPPVAASAPASAPAAAVAAASAPAKKP
jgi:hypothetical protein